MTPEKITEMRKLLRDSTPRPWRVESHGDGWKVVGTKNARYWWADSPTAFDDGSACGDPTRDLIVAAVNALPELLDALESQRAEVERLRADMREAMKLLRAHGQPPDWLKLGDAADWTRRYGALLARHKETNQ